MSAGFLPLLAAFEERITARLDALASPGRFPQQIGGGGVPTSFSYSVPAAQKIDYLSNITVSGVSGLVDADIPDGITASNYLLLTGGTLTGSLTGTSLTLSGDLTVSGAQTLSGAITIPYLSATSTATPSSFQQLLVNASTTLQNFTFVNATGTAATTTNLAVTGTASTSALVASNSFTLAKLTGFLKATAGAVATALIDLANDVTGILPVGNGGTGWANIASGAIPYGNGAGRLATTTAATAGYVLAYLNGVPTWTATTTLANISGTLGVGSGGTGATSFGQGWLFSSGGTNALAASTSPTVNYITATSTTATSTFSTGGLAVGTSQFVVQQTSGNVGIGTTIPDSHLSVLGTAASATLSGLSVINSGIDANWTNATQIKLGYSVTAEDASARITEFHNANSFGSRLQIQTHSGTTGVFNIGLFMDESGNVGIGDTSPAALLTVGNGDLFQVSSAGNVTITGGTESITHSSDGVKALSLSATNASYSSFGTLFISITRAASTAFYPLVIQTSSNTNSLFTFRGDGNAYADAAWNGGGADYAEYVTPAPGTNPYEYVKGSLICLATSNPDTYGFCSGAYDEKLVGAISTFPAVTGNSPAQATSSPQREDTHILLSMLGRVPMRLSLENGDIHIGDRIAAASAPGLGMKATKTSRTIGFALDNFTATSTATTTLVYIEPELTFAPSGLDAIAGVVALGSTSSAPESQSFVAGFFSNLFARLTEWFADAGNGIGEFFAASIHTGGLTFSRATGQELCLGDTCVTEDDLKEFLQSKNTHSVQAAAAAEPSASMTTDNSTQERSDLSGSPVIAIQGANPATIKVGDTYQDLGATITGPTDADKNLGLRYFVDGAAVSGVSLDASTSTTHTIDYVATNSSGTATSTRTVVILPAQASEPSAGTMTVVSTSTDATSTAATPPTDTAADSL